MMMVLVVLSLLLVLAVSFAFLMSRQEGASVTVLADTQTRVIARTGADHAYAVLSRGNRLREYERWYATAPGEVTHDHNPFVDWLGESIVDLVADFEGFPGSPPLYPGLAEGRFRVEDPRGTVLGLNVQDETGKINLNFSSATTLGSLLGASLVQDEADPTGGVYPQIVLEDASFLTSYDYRGNVDAFGGGFVVIDGQLLRYESRRGNVLYNVLPNPSYNGVGGTDALFLWRDPRMSIGVGAFVTTPTAYKLAMYRVLAATAPGVPALFNSLADTRRIAELPRWFEPDFAVAPRVGRDRLDGWPEGLDPVHYQRLSESATVVSPTERFDGGWYHPHIVTRGDRVAMGDTGLFALQLRLDTDEPVQAGVANPRLGGIPGRRRGRGIGGQNLVRLRRADGRGEQHVAWALAGGGGGLLLLAPGLSGPGAAEAWIVEVAERAAVNINTANFETLMALFHGVGPRAGKEPWERPISLRNAARISYAILARVTAYNPASGAFEPLPENAFSDFPDLLLFLRDLTRWDDPPLYATHIQFFYAAQRDAERTSAAVQIPAVRFDSGDVYQVDAFATRHQPTGATVARHAFREWALVGADVPTRWRWDQFNQLAEEFRWSQGNILQVHPAGVRGGRLTGLVELPYLRYPQTERFTRGWRAPPWQESRTFDMSTLATSQAERFQSDPEEVTLPSGATFRAANLESGLFNLWYRRHWERADQDHYLFDVAESDFSNRLSLLWWGARRTAFNLARRDPGLVLRMKDRTLEEAFTEIRYELGPDYFLPNEWYHLSANWKGTELSHLNLLLDGDLSAGNGRGGLRGARAQHTFRQDNGAWVSRTSTLEQELPGPEQDPDNTAITQIALHPDDVRAFPEQGVIVIGDEAIEYGGNTGSMLTNVVRGARGTPRRWHPRGAAVTVFGYTSPLCNWRLAGTVDAPEWPLLPATRGMLRSAHGSRALYRVARPGSAQGYYRPGELGPDAGFAGAGDDSRGGNPNLLPVDNAAGLPDRGVVAVIGVSWRGYFPPGTEGIPQSGVSYPDFATSGNPPAIFPPPPTVRMEYVAYNGISSQGLTVVARYDANFQRKPPQDWLHFAGNLTGVQKPAVTGGVITQEVIDFFWRGSVVLPVSLDVENVQGYHPASVVQVNDEWFSYNVVWDPRRGVDADGATPDGRDDNLFECLIYLDSRRFVRFVLHAAENSLDQPAPFAPWRGAMGTTVSAHPPASRVIPTFATSASTGAYDTVTLVHNVNSAKAQHVIRQQAPLQALMDDYDAYQAQYGVDPPDWQTVGFPMPVAFIAAMYEHTAVAYPPNPFSRQYQPATRGYGSEVMNNQARYRGTNLCKFPTGELPVELPVEWTFGGGDPRTTAAGTANPAADFDAFELRRFDRGDFRLTSPVMIGTPREGGRLQVNFAPPPQLGVIKVNDELIAFRGTEVEAVPVEDPLTGEITAQTRYWLVDVTRGVLGTPVGTHAAGTPLLNASSLRVGRPLEAGGPRQSLLPLLLGTTGFRPWGFLRVVDGEQTEVIGYQRYDEIELTDEDSPGQQWRVGRATAGLYRHPEHPQGLFRGAFGTRALSLSERALVFDQPARFPDWFPAYHEARPGNFGPWHSDAMQGIPGALSPEVSHFQGALVARNSMISQLRWRIQYAPLSDPSRHQRSIGARLVVRFHEAGRRLAEWDEIPTNRPGGLFAFDFSPGASNTSELGNTLYEQTQDLRNLRDEQNRVLRETEGGVRADRLEYRVYFYFKQDAFEREEFKINIQFQGLDVDLLQMTRVLRHEEVR
jgi:hypothetical protein